MYFKTDQELDEFLQDQGYAGEDMDPVVIIDGYAKAVVDIVQDPQTGGYRLVYKVETILSELMDHGMSYPDAVEYFEYNIERGVSYLSEVGPLFSYIDLSNRFAIKEEVKPKKTRKSPKKAKR